jgi:hypothetical protein
MLLRRYRPPLWAAMLLAPLACNIVSVGLAAALYYAFGTRWALLSILPVWFRFAARILAMADSYHASESRRALAVFGACVWLVVSLVPIVALAGGVEQFVS